MFTRTVSASHDASHTWRSALSDSTAVSHFQFCTFNCIRKYCASTCVSKLGRNLFDKYVSLHVVFNMCTKIYHLKYYLHSNYRAGLVYVHTKTALCSNSSGGLR